MSAVSKKNVSKLRDHCYTQASVINFVKTVLIKLSCSAKQVPLLYHVVICGSVLLYKWVSMFPSLLLLAVFNRI